jgi:hypothetical protein
MGASKNGDKRRTKSLRGTRKLPGVKKTTARQRREAIARWRKISGKISLGGLRIRDLIEEGRL